jgi:16S rRNA C967 or C1407 C5-methylase (RsmB/RsmF family)
MAAETVVKDQPTGKEEATPAPEEAVVATPDRKKNNTEWGRFLTILQQPLPVTFHINLTCHYQAALVKRLETEFQWSEGEVKVHGKSIPPPSPMKWYPDKLGWEIPCDKRAFKKCKGGKLEPFWRWLVNETDAGSITRQEAVSMLPTFLLDVQPFHRVIDMCAAPGSKTTQILELMHKDEYTTGQQPTGVLVANDSDTKRAYMLVHQCKRIGSSALIVTCGDAQWFPRVDADLSNFDPAEVGKGQDGKDEDKKQYHFDRILCDVPCSGDGTLRKCPQIWGKWTPKSGLALHPLQLQIALRAVSLLKVGAQMVYSTCTFNPIENEAVIAELLRKCGGAMELVDVSDLLPDLIRRAALTTWTVFDSKMNQYDTMEDVPVEVLEASCPVRPSCFPPTPEELDSLNLHRCPPLAMFLTFSARTPDRFNLYPSGSKRCSYNHPTHINNPHTDACACFRKTKTRGGSSFACSERRQHFLQARTSRTFSSGGFPPSASSTR